MAPHSSVLAWRIPGMGEPGGLPSMRSHRVRHDWSDLAAAAAAAALSQPDCNPMSRDEQEYPVFCGVRFLSSHLLKMLPLQVLAFVHRSWIKHTHTHARTHAPPPSGCNLYPVLSQSRAHSFCTRTSIPPYCLMWKPPDY